MIDYELLTAAQVADILHLKPDTILRMASRNEIGSIQVRPRRRLFLSSHVDDYINSHIRTAPKKLDYRPQLPAPSRIPKNCSLKTEDTKAGSSDLRKEIRDLCHQ